jgi:hypothetical protein
LEKSKNPVEERCLPVPLAAAAPESSPALPPHPLWSSSRPSPLPPWTSLWPVGSFSLGTRARRAGREQLTRDPAELSRVGQEQPARGPTELAAPPGSSSPGPETNFPGGEESPSHSTISIDGAHHRVPSKFAGPSLPPRSLPHNTSRSSGALFNIAAGP